MHVERRKVDRKHVNHNNDNSDDDYNNIHDNADSTTSHVQRPMAVTGKELPGGRNPYELLKFKTEFVDGSSRVQLLMHRHIKADLVDIVVLVDFVYLIDIVDLVDLDDLADLTNLVGIAVLER